MNDRRVHLFISRLLRSCDDCEGIGCAVRRIVRAGFGSSLVLSRQSREIAAEADVMAQGWIREAGRDKQALITFLEKLAAECGAMCEGGSILDSHPSLADRISALEN